MSCQQTTQKQLAIDRQPVSPGERIWPATSGCDECASLQGHIPNRTPQLPGARGGSSVLAGQPGRSAWRAYT